MKLLPTLRRNVFGRHARRDFGETRETVAELLARVDAMDIAPEYAHRAEPDEYPTAKLPVFALKQLEQRAGDHGVPVEVAGIDGGRPLHDLDHVQRHCRHLDSLHGRCADCGMTWAEQADAMGVAR